MLLLRRSLLTSIKLCQAMARSNSDLLAAIKNQEQGIYEPHLQEEAKLDWNKTYIQPVNLKNIALTGLTTIPDEIQLSEDPYSHLNDLPLTKYLSFLRSK